MSWKIGEADSLNIRWPTIALAVQAPPPAVAGRGPLNTRETKVDVVDRSRIHEPYPESVHPNDWAIPERTPDIMARLGSRHSLRVSWRDEAIRDVATESL